MAMLTKLTLTEKKRIEQAKGYAKANNRSRSNFIKGYLRTIIEAYKRAEIELTPFVKSLKGLVKMP